MVLKRWTSGDPILKLQLKDMIRTEFASGDDFKNAVLENSNYFNKWITRVLNGMNFTDRKLVLRKKSRMIGKILP